ncbi:hypothetical protein DM860_006224 [Cuscuta australis]|uniref:DUF7895 domain-containing protein n=1 Tax=Cuscuta australis TaxID=267555 RepID=A0A328DLC7_9ASTE|nr:hypothetical protein DM860_006224 [Cuscuta australis]
MELRLNAHSSHFVFCTPTRESKFSYSYSFNKSIGFPYDKKSHPWKELKIASALPETVATIAVAATVVGTAAALLARKTKASNDVEVPTNRCEECGGSGVCSECKGEGFIMKKLSEESAEKARMTAKNDATRYTAGMYYNPSILHTGYPRSGATARNAMHPVCVVRALVVGNRNGLSQ